MIATAKQSDFSIITTPEIMRLTLAVLIKKSFWVYLFPNINRESFPIF
jgi:hypothetical protein